MANYAAIDCGTNSTRLLLTDEEFNVIERLSTVTRLGEGVDESRTLKNDAIERTINVINGYIKKIREHGSFTLRVAATSAVRDSKNREEFVSRVESVSGCNVDILTGDREAKLSFIGATSQLNGEIGPYLIVDIGGGSTEIVKGCKVENVCGGSLDIGCVRITEKYLKSDPPSSAELMNAKNAVNEVISHGISRLLADSEPPNLVLALSGTASALVMIRDKCEVYSRKAVHNQYLKLNEIKEIYSILQSLPLAKRRQYARMEAGRAEVILAGTLILIQVLDNLRVESCRVSENDILDGLVLGMSKES